MSTITAYVMDPATDVLLFADELADGMQVMPEGATPGLGTEDEQLRAQRFRTVSRLRRQAADPTCPELIVFVGEWVDGYQQTLRYNIASSWIVRRDSTPAPDAEASQ
jgi:hypothetical protein